MTAPEDKPRPDRRASDPAASAWVSANAGSGKTHVLVNRVIRLLLDGAKPETLLCITFTRAAAAEMATRLFRALSEWAFADDASLRKMLEEMTGTADGSDLAQARRLFARALETPGGLRIQTIHAFCESILQRFPLEAEITAGFEVLDEHSAAELLHEVRAEVLAAVGGAPDSPEGAALAAINRHLQEDAFGKVISHCIARRGALARAEREAGVDSIAALRPAIAAALGIAPERDEQAVIAAAAGAEALDEETLRRWAEALSAGGKTDSRRADEIARLLTLEPGRERYEATLALFLTGHMFDSGRGPRQSLMSKAVAEAEPELAEWATGEQARVAALYEEHKAAVLLEATVALLTLAEAIIDAYAARKRARAALDYDDLIRMTGNLLRRSDAAWVLYKLDGGIDHVLIDEAQDTSPEQWEIVRYLSEDFFAGESAREALRTVFAVGDEKQSIYSFQGADPDMFAEMRRHFAGAVRAARRRFEHVPLTASFRSTEEVLGAVDRVFAQAHAADGLYSGGEALVHTAVRKGEAGRIEIWPTVTADEEPETDPWHVPLDYQSPQSPEVRLARRIAGRIRHWLDEGTELTPRGRAIRPGDIMILVRRRNRFVDAMVRALKAHGVPVAGADRMVLAEQIAVMDLIALGRFVLLPDDDLNLAALLKSPLVGLGEAQLFEIAHGRPGSLWRSLTEKAAGDAALAAAAERLRGWLGLADFAPPFSFYARILEVEGGRGRMLARLGTEAEDPLNEFLALALDYEERATPSLQGFLHWLEGTRTEIKRDMEHGRDEVRIMTVHGAKGLESNIVILPDTCSAPDGRHDPPLMFVEADPAHDGAMELPLWALSKGHDTAVLERARARLARRREGEYHRLLYVAMTRARDWLTVCGYEGRSGRSEGCWYDLIHNALAPAAETITDEQGEVLCRRIEGTGTKIGTDKETLRARPQAAAAPGWSATALAPEPVRSGLLAPSRLAGPAADAGAEPPANSPLAAGDEGRFQRGRLIHALLQWLPAAPPDERGARARRYLARPAHGLALQAQEEIAGAVMAVIEDDRFGEIFSEAGLAEVAVAGTITHGGGAVAVSGQIDRLLVSEEEIVIVDYKTNRPAPQSPDEVPPVYLLQMAAYRAVLAGLYPERRIRCALLWTDGPALMELAEERLADALAGA